MESLKHVKHRTVFVLAQAAGDVDDVIRRDADEILVERAVVDRAEAQAVGHRRLTALLDVAHYVRGVEQAKLLQAADRALTRVRGDDAATEARLVEPDSRLADGVAALDRVVEAHGLWLVHRAAGLARCDRDHARGGIVSAHEDREHRLVPTRARPDEVD